MPRASAQGDPRARQFFATLTLFAGSMLLFVAADTLLLLYFAWELMGVCSYLLIAHRGTAEARRAARQAFWTTRATDTGLLFAVLLLMAKFNWATASDRHRGTCLRIWPEQASPRALITCCSAGSRCCSCSACVGKAAQLPLSFWLPDAMVAPAPVSALLHAAAMVAAGPFLLITLHKYGIVGYVKDLDAAKQNDRVTNNPLLVKAVKATVERGAAISSSAMPMPRDFGTCPKT